MEVRTLAGRVWLRPPCCCSIQSTGRLPMAEGRRGMGAVMSGVMMVLWVGWCSSSRGAGGGWTSARPARGERMGAGGEGGEEGVGEVEGLVGGGCEEGASFSRDRV